MRHPDVQLRYDPILQFLRKQKPKSILEVGGGVAGIAQFLNQRITVCDPYYLQKKGKRADWQGKNPLSNIMPVGGVATKLPFPRNSFDVVVCADVLEHLPKNQRGKAIREMLRVSRQYVLINGPIGKNAARWEKRLFALGKRIMGKEHRWLKEHLQYGLPLEEEVIKFLKDQNYQIRGNTNIALWVLETASSAIAPVFGWVFYPLARLLSIPPHYRKAFLIKKR